MFLNLSYYSLITRQLFDKTFLQNSREGATPSPSLNTYQYLNNRKFDFLSNPCPS